MKHRESGSDGEGDAPLFQPYQSSFSLPWNHAAERSGTNRSALLHCTRLPVPGLLSSRSKRQENKTEEENRIEQQKEMGIFARMQAEQPNNSHAYERPPCSSKNLKPLTVDVEMTAGARGDVLCWLLFSSLCALLRCRCGDYIGVARMDGCVCDLSHGGRDRSCAVRCSCMWRRRLPGHCSRPTGRAMQCSASAAMCAPGRKEDGGPLQSATHQGTRARAAQLYAYMLAIPRENEFGTAKSNQPTAVAIITQSGRLNAARPKGVAEILSVYSCVLHACCAWRGRTFFPLISFLSAGELGLHVVPQASI